MKTLKFDNEADWLKTRIGKVTGSRAGDITIKKNGDYKKGFYELVAERLEIPDDEDTPEKPMDRGHYLEKIALKKFAEETGKKIDDSLVMWVREDNENIAVSPDGIIGKTEAVECKCLMSSSHIEAWLTQKIPSEFDYQILQYFIVNDKLKKLYFVFYNPRIPVKELFHFEINRKDKKEEIKEHLELEKTILEAVEKAVDSLTY